MSYLFLSLSFVVPGNLTDHIIVITTNTLKTPPILKVVELILNLSLKVVVTHSLAIPLIHKELILISMEGIAQEDIIININIQNLIHRDIIHHQ